MDRSVAWQGKRKVVYLKTSKKKHKEQGKTIQPDQVGKAPDISSDGQQSVIPRTFNVKYILLLLLPVVVLLYCPTAYNAEDSDIWWHLAMGRHYVTNLTMTVDHAIFSWTPVATDWIYNTWLGSTLLYLSFQALGGLGLWMIQWGVLIGVFLLIFLYARSVKVALTSKIIVLLLLCVLPIVPSIMLYKPELFSVFLFSAYLFTYFYGKTGNRNVFWLFPLLMILWVNLHGGFMFGLIFVSLIAVCETANYVLFKKNPLPSKQLVVLIVATGLTYLATLINPYGIGYLKSIYVNAISEQYAEYFSVITAYKPLWKFLFPGDMNVMYANHYFFKTGWCLIILAVLLTVMITKKYRSNRFLDPTIVIMNIFFFLWGMGTTRVSYIFPLVALFSIFFLISKEAKHGAPTMKTQLAYMLMFLCISGFAVHATLVFSDTYSWFGQKLDYSMPVDEVRFIKKWKIPGPIFNDYASGGYLLWALYPEQKVFIDSRFGPYWKEVVPDYFRATMKPSPELVKRLADKYGFKTAIIRIRGNYKYLIFAFLVNPEWKLIFFGKSAVVLVHYSVLRTLNQRLYTETNISPLRFEDVHDPAILYDLFMINVRIRKDMGQCIRNIFNSNVSNYFPSKEAILNEMDQYLSAWKEDGKNPFM